jgi:hypothetical protein
MDKEGDTTNCEHLGWKDGETILINEKNEIIADSLKTDLSVINWYSKKVNDSSVDTSIYVNIKGKNGQTYSFVNYDREFRKWFYNIFLPTLKDGNSVKNLLFDEVTYWSKKEGWISLEKNTFFKTFPTVFTTKRFETNKLTKISMNQDLLNNLIFEKPIYNRYLNACGEHNNDKFPLYNVRVSYYKKRQKPDPGFESAFLRNYETDYDENFEFLKTENGYKLLSVSLKK